MTLYRSRGARHQPISESSILLAGPVRNVAATIEREVKTLMASLANFKTSACLVIESDSSDATVQQLEQLSKTMPQFSYVSMGQLSKQYPRRTDRIAQRPDRDLIEVFVVNVKLLAIGLQYLLVRLLVGPDEFAGTSKQKSTDRGGRSVQLAALFLHQALAEFSACALGGGDEGAELFECCTLCPQRQAQQQR